MKKITLLLFALMAIASGARAWEDNGIEFVDLGLPSGTLWATCNLGASSPEESGYYYAWGEHTPRADFQRTNYSYYDTDTHSYTEYCAADGKTVLLPKDYAFHLKGKWALPDDEQIAELLDDNYTTSVWTTQNGISGRLVTSSINGKSIFLPAAGVMSGKSYDSSANPGQRGDYWTTIVHADNSWDLAMVMSVREDGLLVSSTNRWLGCSIRPVCRYAKLAQPYAVLTGGSSLYFYYDDQWRSREGEVFELNAGSDSPKWLMHASQIDMVIFDESFANARPTSTHCWFMNMGNLDWILGLSNLNTSEVTDMAGMFANCKSLTDMLSDLSGFNTEKVVSMHSMFSGCTALTDIDLSGFNTSSVTDMESMFYSCSNLTNLDVSGLNTSNVTNMSELFYNCENLTSLDLSNFDTSNVTDMTEMFYNCQNLSSLDLSGFNTSSVTEMTSMFSLCTNLTKLNMRGFDTQNVTVFSEMFRGCSSLTDLDLSYFNTEAATGMYAMFMECSSLTKLDLSTFNTSNLRYTGAMFGSCSMLRTIYVGDGWVTTTIEPAPDMFVGCTSLVGGAGTSFDASQTSEAYAHIDDGAGHPGYFTAKPLCDFAANGIYFKDAGFGTAYVTYKDATYGTYSGTVVIPESVYNNNDEYWYTVAGIGERAFYRCPYLTSLTIPASVDRIENEAFVDAFLDASHSSITCLATTPPSISPSAFDSNTLQGVTLYVLAGCKEAYQSASVWKNFANIQELPYSFVSNGIYYKITGEGTVNVSYRDDNYDTYSGDVTIPSTVTFGDATYTVNEIGVLAFFGCPNLTSVTIPETVTAIGNTSFKGCTSLTDITIPNSVTTLGVNVFENCTVLKNVVLGSGLESIGSKAFQGCSALNLGNITCLTIDAPAISYDTFTESQYQGASLYVPHGSYEVYRWALCWEQFSDIFELAEVVAYDIWIAGTQVTSDNSDDVLGDGTVHFDLLARTLTLEGANIHAPSGYGIQTKFPDLKIELKGENFITADSGIGVRLQQGSGEGGVTILGGGSLDIKASGVGLRSHLDLLLTDGVRITAESSEAIGFQGWKASADAPLASLTMSGAETMLLAKGRAEGSLANFRDLNLSDGIELLQPAGATFVQDVGIVNGNAIVADKWVMIANPNNNQEPYVVYTDNDISFGVTLTFRYDNLRKVLGDAAYPLNDGATEPLWNTDMVKKEVTAVVFSDAFSQVRPTTTYAWFEGMENLTDIEGIVNLNTSEVTDMTSMFSGCSALTSLDLSGFNTANVVSMQKMFSGCSALTSLDLSGFNTSNVTDMRNMFAGMNGLTSLDLSSFNTSGVTNMSSMFSFCSGLTSLDLSSFNTASVVSMSYMFSSCNGLTSLDLSSFDTENVVRMMFMFNGCTALSSLDLSNFNTTNVTNMNYMFSRCTGIQTIYVGDSWSTANVVTSKFMFSGCSALVGGEGTTYDVNYLDAEYARIDGGPSNPGYLTASPVHTFAGFIYQQAVNLMTEQTTDVDATPETLTLAPSALADGQFDVTYGSIVMPVFGVEVQPFTIAGIDLLYVTEEGASLYLLPEPTSITISAGEVGMTLTCEATFEAVRMSDYLVAKLVLTIPGRVEDTILFGPEGMSLEQIKAAIAGAEEIITGIAAPSAPSGESLYDLSGRKLQKISRPGLYINNGKKIVVK